MKTFIASLKRNFKFIAYPLAEQKRLKEAEIMGYWAHTFICHNDVYELTFEKMVPDSHYCIGLYKNEELMIEKIVVQPAN